MTTRIVFDDPMLEDIDLSEEGAIVIVEEFRAAVIITSKTLKVAAVMATVAQRLLAGDSEFIDYFDYFDEIADRLVDEGVMLKEEMH